MYSIRLITKIILLPENNRYISLNLYKSNLKIETGMLL